MGDAAPLAAVDVRRRLTEALEPIRQGAEAILVRGAGFAMASLLFVIEWPLLVVKVITLPDEGRARVQAKIDAEALPDGGVALGAAVAQFIAGGLGPDERRAEAVILNAYAAAKGGLYVAYRPADESAVLAFTEGDLGRGVEIARLMDVPETTH